MNESPERWLAERWCGWCDAAYKDGDCAECAPARQLLATIDALKAENARLTSEVSRLRAHILDIDAHAAPFGEDANGFVTGGYVISVGSLHRALGAVGHTAPKCTTENPCPACR